jgi:hypothetical protein
MTRTRGIETWRDGVIQGRTRLQFWTFLESLASSGEAGSLCYINLSDS